MAQKVHIVSIVSIVMTPVNIFVAKQLVKQRFMNYTCKDCEIRTFTIEQGFINGVCNNILSIYGV